MCVFFPRLISKMVGLDRALVNKVTSTNFDPGFTLFCQLIYTFEI